MSVTVRYFADSGQVLGSFSADFVFAQDSALNAGDRSAGRHLRDLWLDYLEVQLRLMTSIRLERYLASRRVWRWEGEWPVYKTVDTPCIAYTAQMNNDNTITVIALGACYRYPGGNANTWWAQEIRPRVRSL